MRNVPKVVVLLAAGVFANAIVSFTFIYLFVYLTGPRGLSTGAAGVIAGVGGLGLVAGNFTGGSFGDRFGHRRTLLAGATVSGVGLSVLPVVPTPALLFLLPLCQFAAGTIRAANNALVAVSIAPGARRQGFAVLRLAANAGVAIGPPLGALVATHFSYQWLFVADGLGTLLFACYVSVALPATPAAPARPSATGRDKRAERADRPGVVATLRARPAVLVLLVGTMAVDTVYRQQYTSLPVHLAAHGFGTGFYGGLISLNCALILCLELPAANVLRDRAPLRLIGLGFALVGIGLGVLALGAYVVTAVVTMLLLTAGEILYKTPASAYMADQAPDHLAGRFQSLYAGASITGTVLAPLLGGALYESAPALLWPVCGAVGLSAGLVVTVLARRRPDRPAAHPAPEPVAAATL